MCNNFGNLTIKNNSLNINKSDSEVLNYIFRDSLSKLASMSVVEAEHRIAFENLRKLTVELQTKRLRYNAKSACRYFTL